jgi:DNA-binding transcriptional LysR family regulator
MELRQLRYLVALDEERHFTRAAQRLHIAQPALSQQIQKLERDVGLPLVERTTRRVGLTDAGLLLVEHARRAIAEVDDALAELADMAGARTGHVNIGAMQSLGPFDLSVLLAAFNSEHPQVELTVREEVSDHLLQMLHADAVDLAFLSVTEPIDQDELASQLLLSEELVALLAPDHPLAHRKKLRLAELQHERFITFREGAGIRRIIVEGAQSAGFTPRIPFETNEMWRGRAMASRGLGITIVPESDGRVPGHPVAVVPLHSPRLARDITLVWRRHRRLSPAARAFLAMAQLAGPTGSPTGEETFIHPG